VVGDCSVRLVSIHSPGRGPDCGFFARNERALEAGKSVWCHCVVTSHVVSEGSSYAWDFRPYYREEYCDEHRLSFKSKNDLALEMIEAIPVTSDEQVYVLMDSWYTSEKVINACNRKGFHVIAAVKANRLICVSGVTIFMADSLSSTFASLISAPLRWKIRGRTGFMNTKVR